MSKERLDKNPEKLEAQMSVLDVLLEGDVPDIRRQRITASYEIPRLSEAAGHPVVFQLRSLTYDHVANINNQGGKDHPINMICAAVTAPDLKSASLMAHYDAKTNADVVKSLLLPGEIRALSAFVDQLSGFRPNAAVELKNG